MFLNLDYNFPTTRATTSSPENTDFDELLLRKLALLPVEEILLLLTQVYIIDKFDCFQPQKETDRCLCNLYRVQFLKLKQD